MSVGWSGPKLNFFCGSTPFSTLFEFEELFFKYTFFIYILFVVFLSAQINLLWYPSLPKSTFCGIHQCPNLPFVVFLSAQITFCGTPQCANLPFVVFLSTQIYLLWYSPVPKNPSENIGCTTLILAQTPLPNGVLHRVLAKPAI